MALSFKTVQKAYEVFNKLQLEHIVSFPSDFRDADDLVKENPHEQLVYGIDRKSDYGWENLFFFIKNPSTEFIEQWDALKGSVPSSSFSGPYEKNPEYFHFGWF